MLPSSHSRTFERAAVGGGSEEGEGEGRGGAGGAGSSSMMYSAPPPPPPSHLPSMRRPLHPAGQQQLPSPAQQPAMHRSTPYGYGSTAGDEGVGGGGPPQNAPGRQSPPGSGQQPQTHRPYMSGTEHDIGGNSGGGLPPPPHVRPEYQQGPAAEHGRNPVHLRHHHRGRQGEPAYGVTEDGMPVDEHHPRSDHMSHGPPPESSPREGAVVGYADTYDHDDRSHMYRHGAPPPPTTAYPPRGPPGSGGYSQGAHAVSPHSASPPRGPEGPSSYAQPLHPPHSMPPEGYVVRTQSYASSSTASQSPRASPTRMHPLPPPPSSAGSGVVRDPDMPPSRSHMRRLSHAYHEDIPPPHHHTKPPLDSRHRPVHHYSNLPYGGHHRHHHDVPQPRGGEHWRDDIPPGAFGPYDSHHAGRESPAMRSNGRPRYAYKASRMSPHADDYGLPPRHMGHYVYDDRLPPPRGPPPSASSPHVDRDEMDHFGPHPHSDRHARHYYPAHHGPPPGHPDDYPYYGPVGPSSSSSSRGHHHPRRPSPTTPPDAGCHVSIIKREGMELDDGSEHVNSRGMVGPDPNDPAAGGEDGSPSSSTVPNVREGSSSSLGAGGAPPVAALKREGEDPATMGCTCKKSKCLKLYCQCFAASIMCGTNCRCLVCMNTPAHEQMRRDSIKAILGRNPNAFDTKFKAESNQGGTGVATTTKVSHKLGCKCRKSACLKKYCECYHADVKCSTNCRCVGCQNMAPGGPGNGKPHMQAEPVRSFAADVVNVKNSTRMAHHGGKPIVGGGGGGGEPWMMNAAQNLTFLKNGSPPDRRLEHHSDNGNTTYHQSRDNGPHDMPSMPSLVSRDESPSPEHSSKTVETTSSPPPPPSRIREDEDENECRPDENHHNRIKSAVTTTHAESNSSLSAPDRTQTHSTETKPGKAVNTLLMAAYAMTELHSGNSPPTTPTRDDHRVMPKTEGEHDRNIKEVIDNPKNSLAVGIASSSSTAYPTQALTSTMGTTKTTSSGSSGTPPNKKELTRQVSHRSPKRKSSSDSEADFSPSSEAKHKRLIPPPHVVHSDSGCRAVGGGDDSSNGSLSGQEVRSDKEDPRERQSNSDGFGNSSSMQMPPIPTSVATPTDPRKLKRSRLGSARKPSGAASGGWGNSDDAMMEASSASTPSDKTRFADNSYGVGKVIDHTPRQTTSTERTGVESEDETSSTTSHQSNSPTGARGAATPTEMGGSSRPMHRHYLHQEAPPHQHHPISASSSSSIATPMEEWNKSPSQEDQEMKAVAPDASSGASAASSSYKVEPEGDLLTPVSARCMAFRHMDMNGEATPSERPSSAMMATDSIEEEGSRQRRGGGDSAGGCGVRGDSAAVGTAMNGASSNNMNAVAL